MVYEVTCDFCQTDLLLVENKLFFSEAKQQTNIVCTVCHNIIRTEEIDGWFFVQTKEEAKFQLEIDNQNQIIKYPL